MKSADSAETMLKGNLTPLQMAVLACRYAPNHLRCDCKSDCCSGWRTNAMWMDAISYVVGDAVYWVMPQREPIPMRFVKAVLLCEYGKRKIALTDVGSDLGMSAGTCTNYKRRITDWPLHQPSGCSDSAAEPSRPIGQEIRAFSKAEEVLRAGGFIE